MISAVLILLAIAGILFRGLNLGIEFKGGAEFYVPSTDLHRSRMSARRSTVPGSRSRQ